MGIGFENWDVVEGPIYMGANSSWEVIWFAIAALLCIVACISGSRHELDAYKKLKDRQSRD